MMFRFKHAVLLSVCLLCIGSGCSHFIEARTIELFAEALQHEDLNSLKSSTSHNFEQKALRLDKSVDDLKILRLPEGKTSVVKVSDVSKTEKIVTVEVGEKKRKLRYRLTRDRKSKKWVVDDIYVKQKHKGLTATKSVTEQMDLLLTVREFLAAWQNEQASRNDVLASTTPEFGQVLAELPPIYLARLTRQVAGKQSSDSHLRPVAHLDKNIAIVRLPRTTGEMVISFKLQRGSWKVDDIAVESKTQDGHLPSVRKTAMVMVSAIAFLEAYAAEDKQTLARLCTEKFYESLVPADLSSVKLPSADMPPEGYRVKHQGGHADFVIPEAQNVVKLSFQRQEHESDPDSPAGYLVEEVTIYELDGQQEKRISALFTANAMLQLFAESLSQRDLPMLRRIATPDFSRRVWQRLDEQTVGELPLSQIVQATPRVVATTFHGAVTEITVTQGSRSLIYVLRNWNGKLRVDDVLVSLPGRPKSLKATLELMIPVYGFARGIATSQLDLLGRSSSKDFNRLIWKQVRRVPNLGASVLDHLRAPLTAIELEGDAATLILGDDRFGSRVHLVKEYERWAVDEVELIAGPQARQRHRLKQTLKLELANHGPSALPSR